MTEKVKKSGKRVKSESAEEKQVATTDRATAISALLSGNPQKKYSIKGLAALSGGNNREGRYATTEVVDKLLAEGTIEQAGSGKYRISNGAIEAYEGIVDMMASGSMFVKVEELERDIFINQRKAGNVLNGDKVKVVITHMGRGGVPEGEILTIVERSQKSYVGVVELSKNFAFVRVDSRKVPQDIFVPIKEDSDLKTGQKVLVRILDWAAGSKSPVGEILDVFGFAGNNDAEMHAILAEYDLPYKFENEVEEAAQAISEQITDKDYAERRDFRGITTFTIDPADAKDFDDALSARLLSNGEWEIGVHIADVTHYVTEGSIVDTEGESRATSVYLVDRTVPMLPEKLSNGLCSLRPNEEKLAFSAVFHMDDQGELTDEWFGRTVILSDRRFTYAEAQDIIETGEGDLKEEVLKLHSIAQKLRASRFKNGSISFEREEAKFDLDENGKPLGVYFKEQKESNQLVEEFMLLANRKVAEFVGKKKGAGANAKRTFVYRVHDKPNVDKLAMFKSFIMRFGYDFKAEQGKAIAKEINKLMGEIKGKSEENVISTLAIRTMAKAYYTTENIGHYGLAFDYYTHFTSPIRRYPDMMVHRLLAHYLAAGKSPDSEATEALCEHSSQMEVRAAEAERASIKYKMVEFMLDHLGMEFDGHISGITEWGIYVELDQTHIEGMVSLRDLAGDFYDFDQESYSVTGRSTGRRFMLGDGVRIRVQRADLARKQLDFALTASIDFETGKTTPVLEPTLEEAPVRRRKPASAMETKNKGKRRNKQA